MVIKNISTGMKMKQVNIGRALSHKGMEVEHKEIKRGEGQKRPIHPRWMGRQLFQRAVLPVQREMERRWKRWQVNSAGGEPERMPRKWLMLWMQFIASSLHPPKASPTNGIKVILTE